MANAQEAPKAKRKQLPKQQSDQEPRRLASNSSHHEGKRRRTNPEDEAQRKQHKRQRQIRAKIRSSTRKPPPRTWPPPGANCALPRTLPAPAAAGECLICTRRGHPRSRYACTTLSSPPAGHFLYFLELSHIIMIIAHGGASTISCQTVVDVLLARHARVLLEQWQRRAIFWCFTARRLAVPKMWPTKCAPLPFDAILHRGACR